MYLVKPKKGTAMETIGKILKSYGVGLRARQETEEVVETNLLWPAPQAHSPEEHNPKPQAAKPYTQKP